MNTTPFRGARLSSDALSTCPGLRACAVLLVLLGALTAPAQGPGASPAPATNFISIKDTGVPFSSFVRAGAITHDRLLRTYLYYVPLNLPPAAVPLVFVLHGGGGSALSVIGSHEGRWNELADLHKLIVIYPNGRDDPAQPTEHHWNDCRNDATNTHVFSDEDDVGFIDALVGWADGLYQINSNRLYLLGESNGGMMAYRIAEEKADLFAAIGVIIGNMPLNSECAGPMQPMPMLIMNGTADTSFMPFGGGCIGVCPDARGEVISSQDSVDTWVGTNQASMIATTNNLPDLTTNDTSTVTVISYTNGISGDEVIYYRINGGGHTIPGFNPPIPGSEFLGAKNQDISAADEIWNFFSGHSAP